MQREGPPLEALLRRLAETPEDFLAEPRFGASGVIEVRAVVADLLRLGGHRPEPAPLAAFAGEDARRDRNRLASVLIATWLLADEWFLAAKFPARELLSILQDDLRDLAGLVAARKFVTEAERREELARLVLARLGARPAGETPAQAQDRLTTLSSVERARVLRVSQAAAQRAREIREALARKAAEESADKWTRE
ncbi:MAG: hypothetical protein JNL92_07025 [Opitutaceae bacterium]|nr:hypothetical protein [Opitutaceae bacterium]